MNTFVLKFVVVFFSTWSWLAHWSTMVSFSSGHVCVTIPAQSLKY